MIFKQPKIDLQEQRIIEQIRALKGQLSYLTRTAPGRWYGLLRRNASAKAIRGSNSIEGYNVTKEDAIAAEQGDEPMAEKNESWKAVVGYRQAMTYVLQLADDPHFSYSADLLRSLHFMMIDYDLSKSPGKWRPGSINVVDEQKGRIVYEAPDAEQVPALVKELTDSLNSPLSDVPTIIRAAMAHLNLAMIHPFRDGNGRMARCLQTLVLAREGILAAPFSSIEEYLGRNTREYYDVLAEVGDGKWQPQRDTKPWIRFCLTAHYRQAVTLLRRTKELSRVWDRIRIEVEGRKLPERTMMALADAAYGLRVRNSTYRLSADISDQIASRDLKKLSDAGLLMPSGTAKGRFYLASPAVAEIREISREPKVSDDPFA